MNTDAHQSDATQFALSLVSMKSKADQGDPSAQEYLGSLYMRGNRFVEKNSEKAMAWYSKAAKAYETLAQLGDVKAQYKLGWLLHKGYGVTRNDAEAQRWFCMAAEGFLRLATYGNAEAQFYLGSMYAAGHGVEQNYSEALKWTRTAHTQGDPAARLVLSIFSGEWTAKAEKRVVPE